MKQNLQRNKNLTFRVTDKEYDLVRKRMKETRITNLRAYLLKMALNGRIITVEMESVNELGKLLRNISGNINQIAARANSTGKIYDADITGIKAQQEEIWQRQDKIIRLLTDFIGEAG